MGAYKQALFEVAEAICGGYLGDETKALKGLGPQDKISMAFEGYLFAILCDMELPKTELTEAFRTILEVLDDPRYDEAIWENLQNSVRGQKSKNPVRPHIAESGSGRLGATA